MWTAKFWKESTERAVKTFAQSLLALLGANSVNILEVDWQQALGVSVGAGVLSILTSIASSHVSKEDSPSLV